MRPTHLICFALYVAPYAYGDLNAAVLDPPVLPVVMGTVLDAYKPLLADYAKKNLPATVGSCTDSNPPAPCLETGYLLAQKSSLYDIKARWISGINTMTLGDLVYKTQSTSGAVSIDVVLGFESLPLSLRIDACLGSACANFFDGTSACCGGPKTVAISAGITCSETYPFLRNFTFTKLEVRPSIELQFPVNGKPTSLFDVTKPVEAGLNTTATAFLQKDGLDLLNKQIKELFGEKVFCTQAAKDAATLPPTTTVPSTTSTDSSPQISPTPIPGSNPSTPKSPGLTDSADSPATAVPTRTGTKPSTSASTHPMLLTLPIFLHCIAIIL